MPHVVAVILQATVAFAATNVDDVFVLMVLYGAGTSFRTALAGQYLGLSALFVVALVLSLAALAISPAWVGLLGLAPIALAIRQLVRRKKDDDKGGLVEVGVLQVATVTFANGADNLAVYGPLFARRPAVDLIAMGATFAVLVFVWCFGARALTRAPGVTGVLKRWGHILAPLVLVGLGIHILASAGTLATVVAAVKGR